MRRTSIQRAARGMLAAFVVAGPLVVVAYTAADRVPGAPVLWILFVAVLATAASVVFLELDGRAEDAVER